MKEAVDSISLVVERGVDADGAAPAEKASLAPGGSMTGR
jgi:hypothetical protein